MVPLQFHRDKEDTTCWTQKALSPNGPSLSKGATYLKNFSPIYLTYAPNWQTIPIRSNGLVSVVTLNREAKHMALASNRLLWTRAGFLASEVSLKMTNLLSLAVRIAQFELLKWFVGLEKSPR